MRVAWTGHRPDLFDDPAATEATVRALARVLVQRDGAARFLVGGQRGVDTWAAQAAITLGVPLSVILPLEVAEFTSEWAPHDRAVLERTLAQADELRVVGGDPQRAFTERNRLLATAADVLVAVWTGVPGGGTAETIALARAHGTSLREILLTPSSGAGSAEGRGI